MIFDSILPLCCEYFSFRHNFWYDFRDAFFWIFLRSGADCGAKLEPDESLFRHQKLRCCPRSPFGSTLAPFGSLLAPFGSILDSLWAPFDHRLATFRLNFRRMLVASRLNFPSSTNSSYHHHHCCAVRVIWLAWATWQGLVVEQG